MSVNHLDSRWEKVVRDFRQVCVLRRQDRRDESDALLRQELPRSISEWSRHDTADANAKRARLDSMFQQEQRRIDDLWVMNELLSARLREEFLPVVCSSVCSTVGEELRRAGAGRDSVQAPVLRDTRPSATPGARSRVAFDDIPSVIDLLLETGFSGANRRSHHSTAITA